jgi:ATP-dependent helicase HrpA
MDPSVSDTSLEQAPAGFSIVYPADLPISALVDSIKSALADHQLLIVCGDTGCGKTTQLPKIVWEAGCGTAGRIGITQPRRLAATSMAQRVADELRCPLGGPVGFQIRFEDQTSQETVVKFMTDGILLAEIAKDRELRQYDALIIDEAHERSLNIDFILGYLKELLRRRRDLKVIVSSATLDTGEFSRFFGDAPVIRVQGRTYGVEDVFRPTLVEETELSDQVLDAIECIRSESEAGDVLVFLPGEREIREAAKLLKGQKWPDVEVLQLFARLSMNEQHRVFRQSDQRRVVLATNVAETSLTIPNIHYVVDSGLVRLSRYNPYLQVQTLQIEQVSQASARQRRGRCGRVAEGQCLYLYNRETLERSDAYTDPEILRTSLAGVILQMKILGLPPIEHFPFINPPPSALVSEGYRSLRALGALDRDDRVTTLGRQMAAFPLDPVLSRMVCQAKVEGVLDEVVIIAAFLSIRDPRERPSDKQALSDQAHQLWADKQSDFIGILNLWKRIEDARREEASANLYRAFCKEHFLNFGRIREWRNLRGDLIEVCRRLKWAVNDTRADAGEYAYDRIHRSLLAGLPMTIGVRDERRGFQGTAGRTFYIFPGSGVFGQPIKWVVAFALVETTKLYARLVAEIDPTWLEDIAPHLCRFHYRDIHYSPKEGCVFALKTVTVGGLEIQRGVRLDYGAFDPQDARRLFISDGMVKGAVESRHPWIKRHQELLQTVAELEARMRKPGSLLDEKAIANRFDEMLPPTVYSTITLDAWLDTGNVDFSISLEDAVYDEPLLRQARSCPDTLEFSGQPFRVTYRYAPNETSDGMSLICPSDLIWLLPAWAPDWLVPGWLSEKVQALIKSLPKPLRVACSPARQRADAFVTEINSGRIDSHQPLLNPLADYLHKSCKVAIRPSDFDLSRLPAYLFMKIVEVDDKGKTIKTHTSVPDRQAYTSRLSSSITAIQELTSEGSTEWPGSALSETIYLDDKMQTVGYPALADEKTRVCQRVFLNEIEAVQSHRAGIVRLYRLQNSDLVNEIKRGLDISNYTKLALRSIEDAKGWLTDFMDAVIWEAISDNGRQSIRDRETYEARVEVARGELSRVAAVRAALLNTIMAGRVAILDKCKKITGGKESLRDIEGQLAFLFRRGFIKDAHICSDYSRYLRALEIRVERLGYSTRKDLEKLEEVRPFVDLVNDRLLAIKHPERAVRLWEFAHLLQEYRIAVFAPEVGTGQKVSKKRLERFWEEWIERE